MRSRRRVTACWDVHAMASVSLIYLIYSMRNSSNVDVFLLPTVDVAASSVERLRFQLLDNQRWYSCLEQWLVADYWNQRYYHHYGSLSRFLHQKIMIIHARLACMDGYLHLKWNISFVAFLFCFISVINTWFVVFLFLIWSFEYVLIENAQESLDCMNGFFLLMCFVEVKVFAAVLCTLLQRILNF